MLLLELPQLGVDVEGSAKVRLPLLVSVLGQVAANKRGNFLARKISKLFTAAVIVSALFSERWPAAKKLVRSRF